jgi:hypothetical protein
MNTFAVIFSLTLSLVSITAWADEEDTLCPNYYAEELVIRYAKINTSVCKVTSNKPVQMNDQHQTNHVGITCSNGSKKVYSISMFKYPDDEFGDGGCGSFAEVIVVR